jgi:16S rRNA (guanine527-N7)-methyltransferase
MEAHYRLLCRWNPVAHLTSITGEEAILDRHFLESLEALAFLDDTAALLVDVGTGNGFPALPLLLLRPSLRGLLLEPSTRKRAFLKEVLRETDLGPRVDVAPDRIQRPEDLAGLGPFRYLTSRAVGIVGTLVAGAAAGLVPGGRALLFLGRSALDAMRNQQVAGLELRNELPLTGREASFLAVLERPSLGPGD